MHPDKSTKSESDFCRVQEAYDVLKDGDRRRTYDVQLKSNFRYFIMSEMVWLDQEIQSRVGLIWEEVSIDDFDVDESSNIVFRICRCGGRYESILDNLENGWNVLSCSLCSFKVRVLCE